DVGRNLSSIHGASIQMAYIIINDQGKVEVGAAGAAHVSAAGDEDLTVGSDDQPCCEIVSCSDRGEDFSSGAEGGIEPTQRIIAGHGEIIIVAVISIACHDDPACRIERNGIGAVIQAEVGQDLSPFSERCIEASVAVVPDEEKVVVHAVECMADDEDLHPLLERLKDDAI